MELVGLSGIGDGVSATWLAGEVEGLSGVGTYVQWYNVHNKKVQSEELENWKSFQVVIIQQCWINITLP